MRLGADKSDRDARQAMDGLVLLLIDHIGDESVLDEALDIVQQLPPAGRSAPADDTTRA